MSTACNTIGFMNIAKAIKRLFAIVIIVGIVWGVLVWKNWNVTSEAISEADAKLASSTETADMAAEIIKMATEDKLAKEDVNKLKTDLETFEKNRPTVNEIDPRDWKAMLALPFTSKKLVTEANQAKTAGNNGLSDLISETSNVMDSYYTDLQTEITGNEYEWRDRLGSRYDGDPSAAVDEAKQAFAWSTDRELYEKIKDLHGKYASVRKLLDQNIKDLQAKEAEASKITTTDGESGDSVRKKIDDVAALMGARVVYTPSSGCSGEPGEGSAAVGYFCQGYKDSRDQIFLNTAHPNWPTLKDDPWLLDTVKHELSHRSIMITCGTTKPDIAGDKVEAVTNSYSYAYYGADRARTERNQEGIDEYKATPETDAIAEKIHDGQCS